MLDSKYFVWHAFVHFEPQHWPCHMVKPIDRISFSTNILLSACVTRPWWSLAIPLDATGRSSFDGFSMTSPHQPTGWTTTVAANLATVNS
eukprot:1409089-Prymnesium_polylepis.2